MPHPIPGFHGGYIDRLIISSTFFAKIILFLGLKISDVSEDFSHLGSVFSKNESFHVEI